MDCLHRPHGHFFSWHDGLCPICADDSRHSLPPPCARVCDRRQGDQRPGDLRQSRSLLRHLGHQAGTSSLVPFCFFHFQLNVLLFRWCSPASNSSTLVSSPTRTCSFLPRTPTLALVAFLGSLIACLLIGMHHSLPRFVQVFELLVVDVWLPV